MSTTVGIYHGAGTAMFWIRRGLFGTMALATAVIILGVSVLVSADSGRAENGTVAVVVNATGEAKQKIEYYLPYPGVLPDSPLYKVKMVRDRISMWLTFGEEKKAERELLYADKRINAAVVLSEGGKKSLGVSTATKASKYLYGSFVKLEKAAKSGKDVKSMLLKLGKASAKHAEILEKMAMETDGGDRAALVQSLALARLVSERSGQLILDRK